MWRFPELASWHGVQPFPHVILEDVGAPDELMDVLEEEPVARYESDLFAFDATAPEPTTAAMRELRDAFAAALMPGLAALTGKSLARADMRAFAYRPGHYLLPHSDHQDGLHRELAYAYYLDTPQPPVGGELELFACEAGATRSAKLIEPRAQRLVVFDVSDVSLHQVREVLDGLRLSLAGWFYR